MLSVLDSKHLELAEIFPVTLMKYVWANSDDLNQALIELILAKEKEDPGISTSNVGGWHSRKDFQRWHAQSVQVLLSRIRTLGAAMLERVSSCTDPDMQLWTIQAWANINRLGNCNRFHNHIRNSNLWSGVYYLSTGMEITDKGPKAEIVFADQHRVRPSHRDELGGSYHVRPEPGLMLLFPSSMAHMVECHQGSGNRISVAFNLKNEQFTTINYEIEKSKPINQQPVGQRVGCTSTLVSRNQGTFSSADARRRTIMQTAFREIPKPVPEILAYQNDRLLKRYSIDYGATLDESHRCFQALKEFLIVCAVKPGYKVTSDPVDRMWHTFLLFTKDYKQFCEDNLGMFINHEPFEDAAPESYLETRSFVEKYFGHIDEQIWSVDAKADCSSGCGD